MKRRTEVARRRAEGRARRTETLAETLDAAIDRLRPTDATTAMFAAFDAAIERGTEPVDGRTKRGATC